MKLLISSLVVLIVGVVLALVAHDDPGYILINYHGWSIETSLVFLVVAVIVAFIVTYYLLRLLANSRALPRRLRRWHEQRRMIKARNSLNQGLLAYTEGRWDVAERLLLKNVAYSESPLLNYLTAAQAAHQLGAKQRRDRYLKQAQQHDVDNEDVVVSVKAAELLLEQQQYEQAQAILRRLHKKIPGHSHVLRLLRRLYIEIGDWEHLIELIPRLKKRNLLTHDELGDDEIRGYMGLLEKAGREGIDVVRNTWQRLPSSLMTREPLLAQYARHLIDAGVNNEAIPLLRKAIERDWSEILVDLFGQADGDKAYSPSQLAAAESWLKDHPDSAVLLLTLGRLAARNQMPSKARKYFEMSIAQSPHPVAYRELGQLLEQSGEQSEATACFQKSFAMLENAGRTNDPNSGADATTAEVENPQQLLSATR